MKKRVLSLPIYCAADRCSGCAQCAAGQCYIFARLLKKDKRGRPLRLDACKIATGEMWVKEGKT